MFSRSKEFIKKHRKRLIITGATLLLATPLLCDGIVSVSSSRYVYDNLEDVPDAPAAVVLGTARHTKSGLNPFYTARMEAAVALFEHGTVRGIIVSGDNGQIEYNEPSRMRKDLIASGIPKEYITEDFAGFRTLDSIIRADEVFGQKKFIVVSQRFHAERAVFIARTKGLEAYGYAAQDAPTAHHVKVRLREVLARTVAVLDVWILKRGPKFLGQKEQVNLK